MSQSPRPFARLTSFANEVVTWAFLFLVVGFTATEFANLLASATAFQLWNLSVGAAFLLWGFGMVAAFRRLLPNNELWIEKSVGNLVRKSFPLFHGHGIQIATTRFLVGIALCFLCSIVISVPIRLVLSFLLAYGLHLSTFSIYVQDDNVGGVSSAAAVVIFVLAWRKLKGIANKA